MKLPVYAAAVLLGVLVAAPVVTDAARLTPSVMGARSLALSATHGVIVGRAAPGARLDLYVRLPGRRDAEVDEFATAVTAPESPWYARYLTPEQFGSYFGANPMQYAQAVKILRLHGFIIDELPANRTDIIAHGSVSAAEALFQTPIDMRFDRGRTYYANRYPPVLPRELTGAVVAGLDDYVVFHPMLRRNPDAIIQQTFSWGPDDVAAAYEIDPLYSAHLDGKGVTIANATCGAALTSDLTLFQTTFSLPSAALVSTAEPKGSHLSTSCGRNTGYGNGESSMDVDWALAVAREATFHQVVATGPSNHDFDLVYEFIVNALGDSVHVATTSWGTCERDMKGSPSLAIDEKLFAQAKAEGQHWFSASGDNGTDDCMDGGKAASVDYPGSSPYVMSVGGTNVQGKIVRGAVTGWVNETTWQESNSNGASGGGVSILYRKPQYQRGITPNDGARDVPDVSLVADDVNDGLWIAQNGQLQGGWGGTSESAPQWAGLLAIVEQRYQNGRIADPHARLYQLARMRSYPLLFHDVTRGNNGVRDTYGTFPGYSAMPGFDLATGLGSFIADALVRAY